MSAADHVEAAERLLACLDDAQRATAMRPLEHPDRTDWHYVPRARPGLSLADAGTDVHQAVHRLLATGLSETAYASAAAIIALDDVLDRREGHGRGRHGRDYSVLVAGEPGREPWSWRVEGHHLSVHVTIAEDEVSCGPHFLGANPARTEVAGHATVEPLAAEQHVARALFASLPPEHRRQALVEPDAPDDILSTNERRIPDLLRPLGVAGSELDGSAQAGLAALLEVYLGRLPDEAATEAADARGGGVWFAWAGSSEPGHPHYYRLQGSTFLVEYDNTQNEANHVHTVWRSRAGDFGDDLLLRHRSDAHGDR